MEKMLDWLNAEAVKLFREALYAELYAYLFPTQEVSYYSFSREERGDSIWLMESRNREQDLELKATRFSEKEKRGLVPALRVFYHSVPIPDTWFEDGELHRIESAARQGGKDFATQINRAFISVLMASRSDETTIRARGSFDRVLAEAIDQLAAEDFQADRLLLSAKNRARLARQIDITKTDQFQNNHYLGETGSGLHAFWSNELDADTALVFSSDAGITITRQESCGALRVQAFTYEVGGRIELNPIVRRTGAIIVIEGIGQLLNSSKADILDAPGMTPYVDLHRLDELKALKSPRFDLRKLVSLCEELNECYPQRCYFAVAMLTRAILDHVPPIFGCENFSGVANSYSGGRSFKECMQGLDLLSRRVADSLLHQQIRKTETLPNQTQVDFRSSLDKLLEEVVRLLGEEIEKDK